MDLIRKIKGKNKESKSTDLKALEDEFDNSIEIKISNIEEKLLNWSIPEVKPETIYEKGRFHFKHDYSIKTTEQSIPLHDENKTIQLFSKDAIEHHRKNNYKFLHIGLIQVAVKPLIRLGMDIPIMICLRDARLLDFNNSLLGLISSNMAKGPIYFNCYPNYSISLKDPHIMKVLTLTIQTKNLRSEEGVHPLMIVYRIHYKVMGTTVTPKALRYTPPGETILLEANLENNLVVLPRKLNWENLTKSTDWDLNKIQLPRPLIEKSKQQALSQVIEREDGTVTLKFITDEEGTSSSPHTSVTNYKILSKPNNIPLLQDFHESRPSVNEIRPNIREILQPNTALPVRKVDFNPTIPRNLYEPYLDNQTRHSPTESDFNH